MSLAYILGCKQATETKKNPEENNPTEIKPEEEDPCPPLIAGDCFVSSFMEGVSMTSNNSNVYIIKGIVLDKIEYGLNVKLVEDLKGNFPENVNTFIAWGDGIPFIESDRPDKLTLYNNHDTLIMLLTPTFDLSCMMPPGHTWFEKPEDYTTLACICSVLKLSDGNVTVDILANYETMLYDDFKTKLNELLIIKLNR